MSQSRGEESIGGEVFFVCDGAWVLRDEEAAYSTASFLQSPA